MNRIPCETPKGEYYTIPIKTMEEKIANWPESFAFYSSLKFSPFGFSSIEIPPFHRRNIANNSNTTTVGDFQSPSIDGRNDLKEAVVNNFPEIKRFAEAGIRLTTENVLIASGAAGAIGSCIEKFCQKENEDEIIMFEPIYKFHLAKMCSKKLTLKTVRTHYNAETNQFEADFEALKKALTPKTKVLLLTNPYNPTCKVFTPEEYKKISEILKDYPDVVVVEDLAYFFCYDDAFESVPYAVVNPHDFKRSITIYSCGKLFNITGTKLGITFGPENLLGDLIGAMLMELQFTSAFDQIVIRDDIISASEKDQHGQTYYDRTRKDLVKRAKSVKEELEKCGVNVVSYEGTYYLILDFESWRDRIDRKYFKSLQDSSVETPELDRAVCRMLASESQIGALPLSYLHLGENPPDRFIRIPINRNDEDLKMFVDALKGLLVSK